MGTLRTSCPLMQSFENIHFDAENQILSFDEYQFDHFIAHRELRGNEVALFTVYFDLEKFAPVVMEQALKQQFIFTEKTIATAKALKLENEKLRKADFFTFKELTDQKDFDSLCFNADQFINKFRAGITLRDFMVNDGTINEGDLLLISDSNFQTSHAIVLWTCKADMITVVDTYGEAYSIGVNAKVAKVSPEDLEPEMVALLQKNLSEILEDSKEYKAEYIAKIEKIEAKRKEQEYAEKGMKEAFDNILNQINGLNSYDELKILMAEAKETKLSKEYRDELKKAFTSKALEFADKNFEATKAEIESTNDLGALKIALKGLDAIFLSKHNKADLKDLIKAKITNLEAPKTEPITAKPEATGMNPAFLAEITEEETEAGSVPAMKEQKPQPKANNKAKGNGKKK